MRTAIGALALLLALPGAVASVHLGALAIASMFYRERRGDGAVQRLRFMVIVPAHNEEAGIGRTIDAVNRAMRLGDHLLVVADRCGG